MEAVTTDNLTKGQEVKDENERNKHRALGDALEQGGSRGGAVVDVNKLCFSCQ